jgi:uncharacterized membrane protein YjjP (DUF1212 family)
VRLALLVSVAGWVVFQNGIDVVTVVVALVATVVTFPIDAVVRRLALPSLSGTVLTAALVGAVPNLVAAAGVPVRVGPAVVGGLFVHLPGRALVSSLIDGLANAPLSAVARGIQAVVTAGALALGMLGGSSIGAGFGLEYRPNVIAVPVVESVAAAAVGMVGLAVAWSMPRPLLVPTVVIGSGSWLFVALTAARGDAGDWVVYAVAAGPVGMAGALVAFRQGSVASVYTSVAILPLVPGFTLYRGCWPTRRAAGNSLRTRLVRPA